MKNIKQIREDYNQNKSSFDKLEQLVVDGLLDEGKLTLVRRALRENHKMLTNAEKNALLETINVVLSDIDISEFDDVELLDEAAKKDYLSKHDPRFSQKFPSDKEAPQILILKRKAIRVFPDNAKVALYYAQGIDKYISVPFGEIGVASVNEAVKVGQIVKHDDGNEYEWKGAQFVNARTGRIANREVGQALKGKHFPEKTKTEKTKNTDKTPDSAYDRLQKRPTFTSPESKYVQTLRSLNRHNLVARHAGATGAALNQLARKGITRGAYAAYKRIRGMKEERELIENSFTTKVQQLKEYQRALPGKNLDQMITDIGTEIGARGVGGYRGGAGGTVRRKPNTKPKKEPADGGTVRPMRKTNDTAIDGSARVKRDNTKTQTRKIAVKSRKAKKAKEAEDIQADIRKRAEARKLRDQTKTQTRKERVAKRKKSRGNKKGRALAGLTGLGAVAGLGAAATGGAEGKRVTPLDPSLKAKIGTPQSVNAYSRQLDLLNRQAQRQFASRQNMQEQLNNIKEAVEFAFEDGNVTVTPSMAKNMMKVYNSVNEENKKKIEQTMNESANSLKKFINFTSRY